MIWLKRTDGLDSSTMKQIAVNANVEWSAESIIYRGDGIGFADGDPSDSTAIQDAAESILGYRPVEIDAPPQTDQ